MPRISREQKALKQYRQILASILPPQFLTADGFLKRPCGRAEPIEIVPPLQPSLGERMLVRILDFLLGGRSILDNPGASYDGGLPYKLLRRRLLRSRGKLPEHEYTAIESYVEESLMREGDDDVIDLRMQFRSASLAHEAFHDIQGYLLDHYPDIYDRLEHGVQQRKAKIEAWYSCLSTARWRTQRDYQLQHLFPSHYVDSPYKVVIGPIIYEGYRRLNYYSRHIGDLAAQTQMDMGRAEAIPVLLAAAAGGNAAAAEILSEIFGEAGLRSDFAETLPRLRCW